jgi:hypothetical protein
VAPEPTQQPVTIMFHDEFGKTSVPNQIAVIAVIMPSERNEW